jgi:hypothetical protein
LTRWFIKGKSMVPLQLKQKSEWFGFHGQISPILLLSEFIEMLPYWKFEERLTKLGKNNGHLYSEETTA